MALSGLSAAALAAEDTSGADIGFAGAGVALGRCEAAALAIPEKVVLFFLAF